MRNLLVSIAVAASVTACTETPSSFPPCILDSPCPDAAMVDEAGDRGASSETSTDVSLDVEAGDASTNESAGDATDVD